MNHINMIWGMSRASKSSLILYGRVYTAKKMKKAGFKLVEIAKTLGLSITTVRKLLKDTCITEKEDA